MHTSNVRLGFATNSSSTHSVVLMGGPRTTSVMTSDADPSFEFGWDDFMLSSTNERAAYLAVAIYHSLTQASFQDWQVDAIMADILHGTPLKEKFSRLRKSNWSHPYIDHQSAFTLPGVNTPNFKAVCREALEFFSDDRLRVHGGNDNDDSGNVGTNINTADYDQIRIRRDGDNYVVFNWRTGAKIRLTPDNVPYEKSTKPELVDVKITDACSYGCNFCYQGSTADGRTATGKDISTLIQALGINGLGVFEIAFGGGEPTAMESFASTIRIARDNLIVPNFTTFAVDWLLDADKVEAAKLCGGIGVSVHDKKGIGKALKIRDAMPHSVKVMAQHVYGSVSVEDTRDIILECQERKMPLLLLGWKSTGRGNKVAPKDLTHLATEKMLPKWRLGRSASISVDTAMVNKHPELMAHLGAMDVMVTKREGAFSMYVDAVAKTAARSSYEDESVPRNILDFTSPEALAADIGKAYALY